MINPYVQMKFDLWINIIELEIRRKTGVGYLDFPDYPYRNAYHERKSPYEVVDEIIESRYVVVDAPAPRRRRKKPVPDETAEEK